MNPTRSMTLQRSAMAPRLGTQAVLFTSILLAVGCQHRGVVVVRDQVNFRSTPEEVLRGDLVDVEPRIGVFDQLATMCELLYEGQLDSDGSHVAKYDPAIPKVQTLTVLLEAAGWEKLPAHAPFPPKPPNSTMVSGFMYDVWQRTDADKTTAAVVFRGSDKERGDWISNLRFLFKSQRRWDQYEQVGALTRSLMGHLNAELGEQVEVITTGHSLGGGLATNCAYNARFFGVGDFLRSVVAFNSSPVTGATDWEPDARRTAATGLTIYRVYEKGEVLATARRIAKFFIGRERRNPRIVEIRFNLIGGMAFAEHSMATFAARLRAIRFEMEARGQTDV